MYKIPNAIVIDDDRDTIEVFCNYLELIDVNVVGSGHNGKNAVELYEKYKPDLVFLDLMMPDYDGFYALERIRVINPDAKIIVITADLQDSSAKLLDELKPTRTIYKPYDIEQIVEIVESARKELWCISSVHKAA